MSSQLRGLIVDAHDPARVAAFWAGVLSRDTVDEAGGVRLPGSPTQLDLTFVAGAGERTTRDWLHLHLTSTSPADQQAVVAAVLEHGGQHLDVGQRPEEGHVVLADPEGNELCVIEPGNSYLAGTGFLGEVACDGRREVGLFWADALGWPLVWEEGDETAVQSPDGGTKVAWGGQRDEPKRTRNRQRFDLVVTDGDVAAETDRLVALGAGLVGDTGDGAVELTDPDGNELSLSPPASRH